MGQTLTWKLPYPELPDPADVPIDMKELCDRLEVVLTQVRASGSIPGEVRLWPGSAVPVQATYGHWVWCDGAIYASSVYPLAAANIAAAWRTHAGKSDPGAGNFRVPDLRGAVPAGLDAMPGGARANRLSRAISATLAGITGEEYHTLSIAEIAAHAHAVSDPSHGHTMGVPNYQVAENTGGGWYVGGTTGSYTWNQRHVHAINGAYTGIALYNNGGGGAHENIPPTTFVPYICKLDD